MVAAMLLLALALIIPGTLGDTNGQPVDPGTLRDRNSQLVDWSDWRGPLHDEPLLDVGRKTLDTPGTSLGQRSLYQRVDECARRLELRGVTCDERRHHDHYRVPAMESGDRECGFQVSLKLWLLGSACQPPRCAVPYLKHPGAHEQEVALASRLNMRGGTRPCRRLYDSAPHVLERISSFCASGFQLLPDAVFAKYYSSSCKDWLVFSQRKAPFHDFGIVHEPQRPVLSPRKAHFRGYSVRHLQPNRQGCKRARRARRRTKEDAHSSPMYAPAASTTAYSSECHLLATSTTKSHRVSVHLNGRIA